MYFVYIIRSISHSDQIYVGKTRDIKKRLSNHNSGTTAHTKKFKPWQLVVYAGFTDEMKAVSFEQYLKSGSGREFAAKRLYGNSTFNNKENTRVGWAEVFEEMAEAGDDKLLDL